MKTLDEHNAERAAEDIANQRGAGVACPKCVPQVEMQQMFKEPRWEETQTGSVYVICPKCGHSGVKR